MYSRLNPYLNFRDNTRQAMEFYQTVFGGKLSLNTFAEFNASDDPGEANKIMHSMLEADNGIIFMAADTPNRMEYQPGASVQLSLSGDNEPELRLYFEKLSEGGEVSVPLEKAPWGDIFGMCRDRFGMNWMVNISTAGQVNP
ncbi:VOC family protein [uncultured Meiothermus sp.]|jgi:PhnB protein|uniref:VOC family protein n=1 Tax=uncultured Meiothermus sp. TaxID=157471 RepID=UPI002601ECE3|nr:VOC family protein [uncultured Meiothermus sp.]